MAPEQMNDAKSVGPSADVFALGAILFECLDGRPAFVGETALEVMQKILQDETPELARQEVPRALAAVVRRALARRPEDRFPDGEAFARALEEAAAARPSASRGAPVVLAALALALVVVVIIIVLQIANRPAPRSLPPPPPPPAAPPPVPVVPRAKLRETATLGAVAGCHDDIVWGVDVTSSGEPISVGNDGRLRIWDPATGAERRQLGPVGEPIQGVACGAGGAFAVTVGANGAVHRFELGSLASFKVLGPLGESAHAVAISPDGKLVAAGTDRGTLTVIDLATNAWRSARVAQAIGAVAFLPDGDVLVAGMPGLQRCRVGEDGRSLPAAVQTLLAAPQRRVAVSPDGRLAAVVGANDVLTVLDVTRGETVMAPRPHAAQLTAVAFSKDGRWLATGASDGRVALLRPTSEEIVALVTVHGAAVFDLAFTESGRLVSGSFDRSVRVHEIADGALRPVWPFPRHGGAVYGLVRAPNGQIVTGGMDSGIRVWDSARASAPRLLAGHHFAVRGVVTTQDGRLIGSSGHDRTARLWRFADGAPLHELAAGRNNTICAAFTPDGRRFVAAGDDPMIIVWDTTDGRELLRLAGPHGPLDWCVALAVRPDSRRFLSAAGSGWVQEWDIESGEELGRFQPHTKQGWVALALDKRGSRLITGSPDKTARIWDVERGRIASAMPLARLEVGVEVEKVAFAGGTDRVLCANEDGSVSLWDSATARRLDEVKFGARLQSLDVAPDGRAAWVGDETGFVHELAIEDRR
jgi:WD40 repeat protein